jgi:hypothetical protein
MAQKRPAMYRGDRRRKEDQRKAKQDAKRARRAERRESGTRGPEIEAPGANGPASRDFVWFSPSKGRTETTPTAAMPTTDGVDDWTLVSDPRTSPGG